MIRLWLRKLVLVLLGLAGPATGWGQPAAPGREQVLERWLSALGGRDAVEGIQNTYIWSRLHSGPLAGRSEEWNSARGEMKAIADFNSFKRVLGYDGRRGYVLDENGKLLELKGTSLSSLLTSAYVAAYAQFFPERRKGEARYLGLRNVGGVDFHVVEVAAEGGRAQDFYLDAGTFLPRLSLRIEDADTAWTEYSRYRAVGGVMEAFLIRNWVQGRNDTAVYEVEAIQHPAAAPAPGFYDPPSDTLRDFAFDGGADSVEIPFEIWGDHVIVPARSHGSGSLPFLLDTGAEASDLDAALARRWRLLDEAPLRLQGTGGAQSATIVSVDTLYLPRMALLRQRVAAVDLTALRPGGRAIGGVLGYDFFSRFVVKLDFEARRMTLYDPARAPEPRGHIVPFDLDSFVPRLQATVNDSIPARFQVDTGAPATAVFFRRFWEDHGLLGPSTQSREVETSGLGGRSHNREARFGALTLGPFRVAQPLGFFHGAAEGATRSVEDAGLLGMAFWRRFLVTLDYRNRRLALLPNAGYPLRDEPDTSSVAAP